MSQATSSRTKRLLLGIGAGLALALAAFFVVAPGIVERGRNQLAKTDLPAVDEPAQALHNKLAIADMHADTLMWDRSLLTRAQRGHVDLPRLQEGNVALQIFSSVSKSPVGQNYDSNSADSDNITLLSIAQLQPPRTWFSLLERSRFHAQKLKDNAARSNGSLRTITTKGQLEQLLADRAQGDKVTGALFSVEGLQNLEGDLANLDLLYADGMRMAGLTHFFDNEVAGSMHGEAKGGLTDLGRAAVKRMEQLGIVVDLAHASEQSIDDVLSMATRPVVFSHGGVQATCKVNRNLSDEQIRRIAATGGMVGIGYWDAAVCTLSVGAVVDAIEHVIKVGGIQSVGLGSDFDGATEVAWDASQIALITQELLQRGHSESEIAAIMGGNTIRVLKEVLPES
ncbi:dipeptidase [Glutamicibacter uratoxydans]|uniref:Dipeptidase n=1 Tax=Glutamicibacter uratoxydans TaxID=43667 RepID=A0A4Y4DWL3_GLUUR|nr:dipeptidase [Glutamicibacter uratoxydans]GED06781.1 dipeptidase [Glutamicibacter uratoxydans]